MVTSVAVHRNFLFLSALLLAISPAFAAEGSHPAQWPLPTPATPPWHKLDPPCPSDGPTGIGLTVDAWTLPSAKRFFPIGMGISRTSADCPGSSCPLGGTSNLGGSRSLPSGSASPHPAIARLVVVSGATRSYGTGTLIASDSTHSWVLTCAHLFSSRPESITVRFPDGRQFPAQLVGLDRTWDLALVQIPAVNLPPVPLANNPPQVGQWLTACGYGPEGLYRCSRGPLRGYVAVHSGGTFETLNIATSVRQGDSGGPVFDASGALVGVIWGSDGQTVVATFCGRIRQFLRKFLPSWQSSPPTSPIPEPAPDPLPQAPAPPPQPSSPVTRLEELERRIGLLEQELGLARPAGSSPPQKLSDRLCQLEALAQQLPTLRQKVADAERLLGPENLKAVVRDVALAILAENAPQILPQLLLRLAEALGWSTPPSIALVLAARLLGRILAYRARRKQAALRRRASPPPKPPAHPNNPTPSGSP
jgi:hypothetical protein